MKYVSVKLIQIASLLLAATLLAASAHAQGFDDAVSHAGIGVGIAHYNPTDADGQSSRGVVVAYRWHSFHSGWGPTFGLDFHTTNFNETLGGLDARLGSYRMRAILGGFGRTTRIGRFSTSANMLGGYSFNSFNVASEAFPTFAGAGVSLVNVHVDNGWVVKPGVNAWYDIQKHVGVGVGAAYLVARPKQTITTASGIQERHLKTDAFVMTAGVTFGLWKDKP